MDFDFCSYDFNPFLRRKITNPQSNGTEQFFYAVGNKVFVDAITQTEAFDADLKIEIATQTDQPLDYVCKLCRDKSSNQNEVQLNHLDQSDSVKNPSEKNLNQRQILSSNSHLEKLIQNIHTGEKMHQCDICEKRFNYSSHLKMHMRIHTGEKPHECEFCEKRIHTGEKTYECEFCEKRFNQFGNLQTHRRKIHTGKNPVKCDICIKSFTSNAHLKIHRRIHTGEKPYECELCEKRFNQLGNLQTHKRRHHTEEKPVKCEFCGKRFVSFSDLKRHRNVHTYRRRKPILLKIT